MSKKIENPKEQFIHRDLSWLAFNERVLAEAVDNQNPLLERVKFLAIFVNNLDEFFMSRVAGLKRLIDSEYNKKDPFGYYPQEILSDIQTKIQALIARLYEIYGGKITKELEKNNIFLKKFEELSPEQKKFAKRFFETTIFPTVTPMAVDQGHPFPTLPSKTLAFALELKRQDKMNLAILPIPKILPRILKLPAEKDETALVLVEEILRAHLGNFFRGYDIVSSSLFRVIRDTELSFQEEYASDLLKAIEVEVKKRSTAKVVYLEVEKTCPDELLDFLLEVLNFPKAEITRIAGDLDLTFLFELVPQVSKPALCYTSFIPAKLSYENIFDKIKEGDFTVHLPYQSFSPTIDLIQAAATDENVLAIKMTLYRADEDSRIIKALAQAAKNKKQVTVLVELKARLDEEKNINWAKALEESGCHVIYGIPGVKIHSKITLVVRKEEDRIRRYVHLSTGNYNEKTARQYTDIGYFTANDDFAKDVSDVFNVITGYSLPSRWKRLISSPYDLREYFFELIDQEIEYQKKYKNGFILAKMNSLEDIKMIEKLYQASAAGVKVHLLVRGICCLIPGEEELSKNIEVKSVVGRFLEHSRIFIFNNNSAYRVFLSSADWMSRNFDRRIELLFEIYKEEVKTYLRSVLDIYWRDNLKSWHLGPDRLYTKQKTDDEKFNAQEQLIDSFSG